MTNQHLAIQRLVTSENGKRQIHLLAELLSYGIEWNRDGAPGIETYKLGGLETTAFSLSCCMVQWFGLEIGVGVADVMEFFELDKWTETKKMPTVKMLEKKIAEFLFSIESY